MGIEAALTALTEALEANTAALTAALAGDEEVETKVKKGKTPTKGKAKKPAEDDSADDEGDDSADDEGDDSADDEGDADEGEGDDADDLTEQVAAAAKNAIKKDRDAAVAVLKKFKIKKVSEIPEAKHALAIKLFKAVK